MSTKRKGRVGVSAGRVADAQLGRLLSSGRREEAVLLARSLLRADSDHLEAMRVCAEHALQNKQIDEAGHLYRCLTKNYPDDAELWMNLGVALIGAEQWNEAFAAFTEAYRIAPANPDVCGNLANMYCQRGDFKVALDLADQSIANCPTHYGAHNARGAALLKLERYEEALLALARAIELFPGEFYEEAVVNLGLTLHDMRRYEDAYACYEEIYKIMAADSEHLCLLLHSALQICCWDRFAQRLNRLLSAVRGGTLPNGLAPFMFLALPNFCSEDHRRLAECAAKTALGVSLPEMPFSEPLIDLHRGKGGRIRIGYLSADFHDHATTHLLAEVLELHDQSRFEVCGYSYGPDDSSMMRRRVAESFERFRDLQNVGRADAAELIRSDHLDILVDLKGWTHGARLEISALRPAPIIVSWLGYPGTLGDPALADYIIGDPVVTPLEDAVNYSETIVQLPDTYQPNDRRRVVPAAPTRAEVGLPQQGVVYCSFNQSYKITPDVFAAWCAILKRVDGSVLWLLQPGELACSNLRKEAQSHGIDPQRLVFAPRCASPQHLGRLQLASLALDTAPYGSHTTCSDALWCGVPLLTTYGETFASRVAASLVRAAGMPELVEETLADFVERAVYLGENPEALEALRAKLEGARESCALFDTPRFTRYLEKSYEIMLEDACSEVRCPIVVKGDECHEG